MDLETMWKLERKRQDGMSVSAAAASAANKLLMTGNLGKPPPGVSLGRWRNMIKRLTKEDD